MELKLNENLAFSKNDNGEIRIIIFNDDNKVYTIDKFVAFVFNQIADGKDFETILSTLEKEGTGKTKNELKIILDELVADFKKLQFIN